MTNKRQSEGDGKPLAGKLMEDCVMITDGAMGGGVCVCERVTDRKRVIKWLKDKYVQGNRQWYGIVGVSLEKAILDFVCAWQCWPSGFVHI